MQKQFFYYLLFLCLSISYGCKKEQAAIDQLSLLPPETTNGANTFGCLVDGVAYLPRGGNFYCAWTLSYGIAQPIVTKINRTYNSLEIYAQNISGGCEPYPGNFNYQQHFEKLDSLQTGQTFYWKEKILWDSVIYPSYVNYVLASMYDDSIKKFNWFISYDSSGTTKITNFDSINKIISGTFSGKIRMKNSTREKTITKGRFDIKY